LLVVMILFVLLYMVVFHLRFYTATEERVANVRHGDIQAQDALQSVAQLAMSQLIEDLSQDYTEATESSQAGLPGAAGGGDGLEALAAGGGPAGGGPAGGGPGRGGGGDTPAPAAGGDGAGPTMVPLADPLGGAGAGGVGGAPAHCDHLREAIFNPQEQTIGDITIKVLLFDNESRFDLNQIFKYVRLPGEEDALTGPGGVLNADELANMAENAGDGEEGSSTLASEIRDRVGLLDRNKERARPNDRTADAADPNDPDGAVSDEAAASLGLAEEEALGEWVEPEPERVQGAVDMLARAIEVVLSLNEDRRFFYEDTYQSVQIAEEIIEYVRARRGSETQNRIYDVEELLQLEYVTPEVFYGPQPTEMPEEGIVFDDGFVLSRDKYGDLVANYEGYDQEYQNDLELQREELSVLQEEFGSFMNFPSVGGLEGNALTRGMQGPVQLYDEETDTEYVAEPPMPMGLRELFTTFSTGKINLNTASVPILYALLPSLEVGADGDANFVATAINEYRNTFQPYDESSGEEGVETNTASTVDLGQPKRQLPSEEEEELSMEDQIYDTVGMAGAGGLGAFDQGMGMEELETNYFTNIQQIELVDGTDGSEEDILTSQRGIDRVSEEDDSVLQKVLNDYRPVMVFGSTYFTIVLKGKAKTSPLVKTGVLIVKRDPREQMMEVVFWKELQN